MTNFRNRSILRLKGIDEIDVKKRPNAFAFFFAMMISQAPFVHGATVDRIVAVVNNEPIMQSEVEDMLAPIYMNMKEEFKGDELMNRFEQARLRILNQLIEDQLIFQEAEKLGVKVEEHEIDEMMLDFKKQFKSDEEMNEALKFRGLTLNRLRKSYSKQIAIKKMHGYEVRSKIMVSPQEIQAYYDAHKEGFSEKGQWLLSSITIRKKDEAIQKGTKSEDERKKIEWILNELKSGKDFSDMAKQYSQDIHAKEGGELGAVKMSELAPEVEEVIGKLEPGQLTGIVETESSFHIFRLDGKVPTKYKELNEVRDDILNLLYRKEAEEKYKTWIEELKQKAFISIK